MTPRPRPIAPGDDPATSDGYRPMTDAERAAELRALDRRVRAWRAGRQLARQAAAPTESPRQPAADEAATDDAAEPAPAGVAS